MEKGHENKTAHVQTLPVWQNSMKFMVYVFFVSSQNFICYFYGRQKFYNKCEDNG
jgi:hypothetical protein